MSALTFLYRINGGQVSSVSTDPTSFTGIDASFFATVTSPLSPDGTDLAVPKIWDGTSLRNATVAEQTNFITASATDANLQQRSLAINRIQTDPIFRKVLGAIVDIMVQQLNILRTQPTTVFAALTKAQAVTAIVNAINAGSDD